MQLPTLHAKGHKVLILSRVRIKWYNKCVFGYGYECVAQCIHYNKGDLVHVAVLLLRASSPLHRCCHVQPCAVAASSNCVPAPPSVFEVGPTNSFSYHLSYSTRVVHR